MEKAKSSTERNEEYIQKLAGSLPKFEKVKDGVYKFRCPFCGDSKKNPNKRSGYFYLINNSQNYRCFKCNHRSSLKGVLQELKPELYMEYMQGERSKREIFRDVNNYRWMMKIHKQLKPPKSFSIEDLKKNSQEFHQIVKKEREKNKLRKLKKEQQKEMDARDDG